MSNYKLQTKSISLEVENQGAAVTKLSYNDVDILVAKPNPKVSTNPPKPESSSISQSSVMVPHFGCFAMVPFANRLKSSKLEVQLSNKLKVNEFFPINFEQENTSIHGLSWREAWQVKDFQTSIISDNYQQLRDNKNSITLTNEVKNQTNYHYKTQITYKLHQDSLEIDLVVTNLAKQTMPFGLGLHPWFCLDSSSLVQFESCLELANYDLYPKSDFQKIPNLDKDFDPNEFNKLDCCYKYLSKSAIILNKQHNYKCVYNYSGCEYLHIFVNKGIDAFCIEPVTHLPGQLGNDKEDWLANRQQKTLQLRFDFSQLSF